LIALSPHSAGYNLREKNTLFKYMSRRAIAILAAAILTVGTFAVSASAGGTGGGSYCGSGSPSGASHLQYMESPQFTSDQVFTADSQNCSTNVDVMDVTKSTYGHIVTYKAVKGVTFQYASVSVVDPYDSNQFASVNIPLKSGATMFSYNIDNLPLFVYHVPAKKGQKAQTKLVRKVAGAYISGTDVAYPAPPACDANSCG
jgi:hypothetical protein